MLFCAFWKLVLYRHQNFFCLSFFLCFWYICLWVQIMLRNAAPFLIQTWNIFYVSKFFFKLYRFYCYNSFGTFRFLCLLDNLLKNTFWVLLRTLKCFQRRFIFILFLCFLRSFYMVWGIATILPLALIQLFCF